jgi:hypothetical protein
MHGMTRTKTFLLTAAAIFASASPAHALTQAQVQAALPLSQQVAAKRWGSAPIVHFQLMTYDALNMARAKAKGLTSVDKNDLAVADASVDTSVVRIAWDEPETRAELCATVVHEMGHLHGFRFANQKDPAHSANPRSIMFYAPTIIPKPCMVAFPPKLVRERKTQGYGCQPKINGTWICTRNRHGDFDSETI